MPPSARPPSAGLSQGGTRSGSQKRCRVACESAIHSKPKGAQATAMSP